MEFEVFVKQGKFTGDIEAFLRNQVTDQGVSLDLKEGSPSQKALGGWMDSLIKVTKETLQRQGINASDALSASVEPKIVSVTDTSITMAVFMAGYWKFVDLGVKGAKSSAKAPNSPFQYGDKMPPPRALQSWIAFKSIPLKGRDKQAAARSLSFLIARSIRDKGTKATRFFSDSLTDDKINVLVDSIATALGKEISLSMNL